MRPGILPEHRAGGACVHAKINSFVLKESGVIAESLLDCLEQASAGGRVTRRQQKSCLFAVASQRRDFFIDLRAIIDAD